MDYEKILHSPFSGPAAVISYKNGVSELLDVNEKYLGELKINTSREAFLDQVFSECFDEDNGFIFNSAIKRCMESGREQECETLRKMSENCCGVDSLYIVSRLVPIAREEDRDLVYEEIRNLTDEKQTRLMLADIEGRYVRTSEQLNIYNWEYDIKAKEMRPCYRCMRDLGLPALVKDYPEPAIEQGIFPQEYADTYRAFMKRVDSGEDDLVIDIPLTVGHIPFRITYTVERDENGEPVKAFGSAELISEKELDKARTDSNIIAALGEEFCCIYLVDLTTKNVKTIRERGLFDFGEGTAFDIFEEKLEKAIGQKDLFRTGDKRELLYKDEVEDRWVRVGIRAVDGSNDDVKQMVLTASCLDDDQAKRLEADCLIAKQKTELEDRQRLLLKAVEEANRASAAKTEFFSNLSHDIRTPMNAINGFSKIALENIDDREKLSECLDKIQFAGDHLMRLINDILDMSRIESGKMKLSPGPVKIKDIINETAQLGSEKIREKGLSMVIDTEKLGDDIVSCDRLRLRQILLNLLSNAYKYTPEGGTITLSARLLKKAAKLTYEIRVRDTGIGMTADFLKHLWDPFSREQNGYIDETPGTGLGMPIVRNIVNMMQGTIEVESELHKGTEFIIVVDMEPSAETEEASDESNSDKDIRNMRFEGRKVLVVDDTATNLKLAEYVLKKFGFTVIPTTSGIDAISIVSASHPGDIDLILMDVSMPVMDGLEATRRIRALDNRELAGIPIIAMTANAFASDIKDALDAGMNAHVPKPFRQEDLIRKIAENLK